MPKNISEWSNKGLGSDVIELVFQPSEESLLSLIEQEIEPIEMNWKIESVEGRKVTLMLDFSN